MSHENNLDRSYAVDAAGNVIMGTEGESARSLLARAVEENQAGLNMTSENSESTEWNLQEEIEECTPEQVMEVATQNGIQGIDVKDAEMIIGIAKSAIQNPSENTRDLNSTIIAAMEKRMAAKASVEESANVKVIVDKEGWVVDAQRPGETDR